MKQCCICKETKDSKEFNKKRARKDGLQPHCRECSHKKFKDYYYNNKSYHLGEIKKKKKQQVKLLRSVVLKYLNGKECIDCGEQDTIVLEFDHVRGKKKNEIGRLVSGGYSEETVRIEIAKCEIRCANCHRRATYRRMPNCYRI